MSEPRENTVDEPGDGEARTQFAESPSSEASDKRFRRADGLYDDEFADEEDLWSARPAEWLALATASGLVGNLAYDAIKAAVKAALARRKASGNDDSSSGYEAIAKEATKHRCRTVRLPAPENRHLKARQLDGDDSHDGYSEWEVTCTINTLRANVRIPVAVLAGDRTASIEVTLYNYSGDWWDWGDSDGSDTDIGF